jgi:dihydroorotase
MLIKSARIIDKRSPHNGTLKDILIVDGYIQTISDNIPNDHHEEIVDAKGKCVSIGWFDMKVNFRDPGEEFKEDLITGCEAAAAGGFTAVALMPSTVPALQTKSQIEYVVNKTRNNTVNVYPVGALTVNREGKELCELYDMKCAGAVAFTDDKRTIHDSGVLVRALLYSQNIDSLIITFAEDSDLAMQGQVNESAATTRLGFKGVPSLAEELMVARDIQLSEYADVAVHISCVSSAKSVQLIREAKNKGLKITCDVAAYSLLNNDNDLKTFNSNFKVKPPLRSVKDVEALRAAVADNTIDVIVSDHNPQHFESKEVEFDYATYGMIGLETFFGVVMSSMQDRMDLSALVEKFTTRPRAILNLPVYELKEGEPADLTIFDPAASWTFTKAHIHSKSKNTPYLGITFKGKAEQVINFS